MTDVKFMIENHPDLVSIDTDALLAAIEECFNCAQTCLTAADMCFAIDGVMLRYLIGCIRLNLDCADICQTTGRLLSRQGELDFSFLGFQLQAAVTACNKAAEENARHIKYHEFNKITAEACALAAQRCNDLLAAVPV